MINPKTLSVNKSPAHSALRPCSKRKQFQQKFNGNRTFLTGFAVMENESSKMIFLVSDYAESAQTIS